MAVKKRLFVVFMALVCCFSMIPITAGASSVSLQYCDDNYEYEYFSSGECAGNDAIFLLSCPSESNIKWSVSDSSVIGLQTSDGTNRDGYYINGYMYFKKAGTVKIQAKDADTGAVIVRQKIKVDPCVKKISFKDGSSYAMKKGDTATLKYTLKNTRGEKISAASIPSSLSFSVATSDKNVVKIKNAANGKIKIKAVGKGTAKIRVKAKDGSGVTATIKVKVS